MNSVSTNHNHEREGWKGGVCGKCGASRDDLQLGLEANPEVYVRVMTQVFREVKRVLRDDGVLFLNIGDTYWGGGGGNYGSGKAVKGREGVHLTNVRNHIKLPGIAAKSLIGIPWRLALAMQRSGWILRSEIIWEKTNVMPESVKDRPTKSHEQVFMFSKQEKYFYDATAVRETAVTPGANGHTRNARSVWTFATEPFSGAHFACFPQELVRRCLLAGAPARICTTCGTPWARLPEGIVPACTCLGGVGRSVILDPFCGSGTTMLVARELGHHAIGVDLSWGYLHMIARKRLGGSI